MTFKIGDKVRYNKDAFKEIPDHASLGTFVIRAVFVDSVDLGDYDEVHESWLEKVEEEYGVGDIVCARKGKEIIQGALEEVYGKELGLVVRWLFSPTLEKLKEEGYSIQLVEKAKPVEPESDYVIFTDLDEPVLAYRNEDGEWAADGYIKSWEDALGSFGRHYVELVKK